jgi:large subunit ribosomal protein L30
MAVKTTPAKGKAKKDTGPMLKISLVRSVIGRPRKQREVVKGLGLRKMHSQVVRKDCPEIRGMVNKIPHLVRVEELNNDNRSE